jgi:glyoxylase-like metal-dependent hydrolase (beta-lactamase superfamily II)
MVIGKTATMISSRMTRELLAKDEVLLGEKISAHPPELLPQITFSDHLDLFFNNDTIGLYAMPGGHTGSDILVYFKNSNILHIGDLIFSDMFPFCDIEHGGNVLQIAANIQKIIDLFPSNVRIIPGHGREYHITDLIKYKQMVLETTEIVKKELVKKKTLDEIKIANDLKDWEAWGVAFTCSDWIEMIYNSVKK